MNRAVAVAVVLFVAVGVAPLVLASDAHAAAQSDATAIDSCTVVTEPGQYELTADLRSDETTTCIEIRADGVTIDGNGHVVEGPGAGAGGDNAVYRGIYVNRTRGQNTEGVEITDVEVTGWRPGIRSESAVVSVTDSVVRNNQVGIFLEETGPTDLTNVTVRDNEDIGIDTHRTGELRAVDVTLDSNQVGLQTWDTNGITVENSRVVDNENNGINLHHNSDLTLSDVTINGNGRNGIDARGQDGFGVDLTMNGGTVSDNGGNGIAAILSATVELNDVTAENNAGLELASLYVDSTDPGPNVTANGFDVGSAATTSFTGEAIGLEPVSSESLPQVPGGNSTAGNGLNVSGVVSGPVEMELGVDTDQDSLDLWRHDGDEWSIVQEDRAVTDDVVTASVDRNGTYAPVATDDADTPDSGSSPPSTPGDDDQSESTPGDDSQPQSTPGDDDDQSESTPGNDGGGEASTGAGSSTSTPTPTSGGADGETPSTVRVNDTTTPGPDDQQVTANETGNTTTGTGTNPDDAGATDGEGPGFGAIGTMVALLTGTILLARRR